LFRETPGRTQHLNYFRIEPGKYLRRPARLWLRQGTGRIRSQWEGLLAPYLRYREALCGLVLIMDSRHPLTELDLQMLGWFAPTGKPIHVLLSKADKLTRQQQASHRARSQVQFPRPPACAACAATIFPAA
jgi:GTP-binding protein